MARLASAATIEMEDQSIFNEVLSQLRQKKKAIDMREEALPWEKVRPYIVRTVIQFSELH
jgi:hypothetical protein